LLDNVAKTKSELLDENQRLQERVSELESAASEHMSDMELLRDSERSNLAWLEYSPVCTKIISLDLKLQYMSSAGVVALGIDDITEYYSHPYPFEFYPQSFKDEMKKNLERARTTGEIITQEAPVVDTDGTELWFHSTIVPVYDDNDKMDYIMVVSLETTKRKQVENELLQLNDKLENRVASRTFELEIANAQLKALSETDPLTKIANRRVYEYRIRREIANAKRNQQPLSLLMIDIDYFKQYNDNYGHEAGDTVLHTVAGVIQNTVPRETDLVARYGGEEFVVILPYTGLKGASEVAEKIRKNIQGTGIEHLHSDVESVVTISVGTSTFKGKMDGSDDLVRLADAALYEAKRNGRNRVEQS